MTLADGCFDPLHLGHVRYLEAAGMYSRPLVVNVAPDAAIRAKGRMPFQSRDERAAVVGALYMVDQVRAMDLAEAVRVLKPAFLAKGADWRDRLPADVRAACAETGTHIVFTDTRARSSAERLRA